LTETTAVDPSALRFDLISVASAFGVWWLTGTEISSASRLALIAAASLLLLIDFLLLVFSV